MRILILVLTLLILPGCAGFSNLISSGAEANDKGLAAAEAMNCRIASIGSILRKFDTKERADAWVVLCAKNNDVAPIIINNKLKKTDSYNDL